MTCDRESEVSPVIAVRFNTDRVSVDVPDTRVFHAVGRQTFIACRAGNLLGQLNHVQDAKAGHTTANFDITASWRPTWGGAEIGYDAMLRVTSRPVTCTGFTIGNRSPFRSSLFRKLRLR